MANGTYGGGSYGAGGDGNGGGGGGGTGEAEQLSIDGLELNDHVFWKMFELQVIPAKKKLNWVGSSLTDGSSLAGDEDHYENAEMIGKIRVVEQADMDGALVVLSRLVQKLQEARKIRGGLPAVWTPQGSSSSFTVYILDAEIEELPIDFTSGWFKKAPALTFHLYLRPFGYGAEQLAPLGISDPFLSDTITNGMWRFDAGGTANTGIGLGIMFFTTTGGKRLYRPSSSLEQTIYMRFRTGSALTGNVGVLLKRVDATNYLTVRFDPATGLVEIRKTVGGTGSTLATSAAITATTTTFYWLVGSVVGDEVIGTLYASTQDPLDNPAALPLTTISHTLAGADASLLGDGVRGNSGLTVDSTPTSWQIDRWVLRGATDVRNSEPIFGFEVPGVAGEVAAEGRLVVTENSSQSRSHFEWGLEHRTYDPDVGWPYLIDSDSMVTTGFAGSQAVGGGYDPHASGNNVIFAANISETVPLTVCSTGDQLHVGVFKIKARVTGTAGVKFRLAWRVGDGQFVRNDFSRPLLSGFEEIDLGSIILPTAAIGNQTWEGRIEAYGVSGGALTLDYLELIPLERYGVARAPLQPITPTVYAAFDNFDQTAGALHGKTLPSAGSTTWVTSGATGDFAINATTHVVERTQLSDASLDAGRFALAGSTNYAGVQVQSDVSVVVGTTAAVARMGVVARYVDANNWLMAVRQGFSQGTTVWRIYKRVAGVVTQLDSDSNAGIELGKTVILSVDIAGVWQLYGFPVGTPQPAEPRRSGQDSALATGGALQTGKIGIYDAYTSATARTRIFDNFVAFAPTQDVVIWSGRKLEVRADRTEREASAGGSKYGRVPMYRGSRFYVPCAGDRDRVSRVAVKARRTDVDGGLPDPNISDAITAQVFVTPRYLVAPS